jgi:hypothetical protein
MKNYSGMFFRLPRLGVGAALLALSAFTSVSRAGLLYEFNLTDVLGAGVVSGYGQIVVEGGYSISGTFTVTSGPSDALGVWALTGGSTLPPGYSVSPSGKFDYDNAIYPGSDPFLTTTAGILFTRSGGDELNIWANGPNSYDLWTESGGNYNNQFGAYPGGGNNYLVGTISEVPEPINCALAGFGLIFVGGITGHTLRRKLCPAKGRRAAASPSEGRNKCGKTHVFHHLTLRSATGTAQRAVPTLLVCELHKRMEVPQGQPTIARRFNGGSSHQIKSSPAGTEESTPFPVSALPPLAGLVPF